jgi:hypothetical protein
LHPGPDQRYELAGEEETEVAMAQGAERRYPRLPRGRYGSGFAGLAGLGRLDFRNVVDETVSLNESAVSLPDQRKSIERVAAPETVCNA